jgi:hypothetical protein
MGSGLEQSRQLSLEYLYEKRLYEDFAEGVQSYVEKRPAEFPGLSFDLGSSVVRDPEFEPGRPDG